MKKIEILSSKELSTINGGCNNPFFVDQSGPIQFIDGKFIVPHGDICEREDFFPYRG